MCRSIRPLFNFEPVASDDEIRAAARQYVRKISGFSKPSTANAAAFDAAIEQVTAISRHLLDSLDTRAAPRNREVEAEKAKARAVRTGRASARPET
jgi:hypothetical protein